MYNETMGYVYKYRSICLIYDGDPDAPANTVFHCASDEISDYAWVSPQVLDFYDVEQGAKKFIVYYQASESSNGI